MEIGLLVVDGLVSNVLNDEDMLENEVAEGIGVNELSRLLDSTEEDDDAEFNTEVLDNSGAVWEARVRSVEVLVV